jgi:hypothetical protein
VNFLGFVGTEQRLQIVALEPPLAPSWTSTAQDKARRVLVKREQDSGSVPLGAGSALLVDVVAGVCGVFASDPEHIALVGLFPKIDEAHALANGFSETAATGPSLAGGRIAQLSITGESLLMWNAAEAFSPRKVTRTTRRLEIACKPGSYDVWQESYEHRGPWGLAEVRIRIVPEHEGIRIGASL